MVTNLGADQTEWKPVKMLLESWRQEMKMAQAQTKVSLEVTELWLHSKCLFQVEPTVFSHRSDVVREREKTRIIIRLLT